MAAGAEGAGALPVVGAAEVCQVVGAAVDMVAGGAVPVEAQVVMLPPGTGYGAGLDMTGAVDQAEVMEATALVQVV